MREIDNEARISKKAEMKKKKKKKKNQYKSEAHNSVRHPWVQKGIPWNEPITGAISASRKLQLLESDSVF